MSDAIAPTMQRKVITGLGGVIALGFMSYVGYGYMATSPPAPIASPVVQVAPRLIPPPDIKDDVVFTPSQHVKAVMTYSEQALMETVRGQALQKKQEADKYTHDDDHSSLDNLTVNYDDIPTPDITAPQLAPIDTITVKSLVDVNGHISGWVTVGGEMIPVQKGTQFGSVQVVNLTPDFVTFSNGNRTVTRWVKTGLPPLRGSDE